MSFRTALLSWKTSRHCDLAIRHCDPEAAELAETGLAEWAASLPPDDEGLVDVNAGKPVRWIEGQGLVESI